jgi:peptidoglycan hydrolase-like protein with peptidoglycan-binding domain
MDITHDPTGCDGYILAQALLDSRDPRIKYIISNRRIASGQQGPKPWEWRPYSGTNPHTHHMHISVRENKSLYDSTRWWEIKMPEVPWRPQGEIPKQTQRKGMKGPLVREVQVAVGVVPDGDFGPKTEQAVIEYQKEHGLFGDGIVGPQTWRVIDRI